VAGRNLKGRESRSAETRFTKTASSVGKVREVFQQGVLMAKGSLKSPCLGGCPTRGGRWDNGRILEKGQLGGKKI